MLTDTLSTLSEEFAIFMGTVTSSPLRDVGEMATEILPFVKLLSSPLEVVS